MKASNNRFQRTSHKVRRPLNRDVGHKIMKNDYRRIQGLPGSINLRNVAVASFGIVGLTILTIAVYLENIVLFNGAITLGAIVLLWTTVVFLSTRLAWPRCPTCDARLGFSKDDRAFKVLLCCDQCKVIWKASDSDTRPGTYS